jgi:hypothetical protein
MILHQCNLDYGKHCQYAFGTYVQAHDEPDPSNTTAPHTLDCIYLQYSDNEQGGHDLLHLQTNRTITCHHIMPVPITPAIIKQVDRIAKMDGMPKGLKITNHAWIEGVEYDEDEIEDQDYEEEDDKDDDSSYTNDSNDDDDDDNNQYDEIDPDEIAALAEPLALPSDDKYEAQDEVKLQDDNEEEADEEPEVEDDPNPTTAEQQQPPADNVPVTRSRQISKPQDVLMLHQSHLQTQTHQQQPYSIETA